MSDKKISQYTPSTKKIPKGTDLVDFSEDDGAGGFDTVSRPAKDLVYNPKQIYYPLIYFNNRYRFDLRTCTSLYNAPSHS
ncbi:unnamed protein product [marine sediment metagenome]|uniref:Uncharacterized protein n=1 Tax=marine sediment metagenome TaxID=412755 RepID=X0ZM97_9ZZZZ